MRAIVLVPALALAVCCGTPEDSGPRKPAVCEEVGPTTEELLEAEYWYRVDTRKGVWLCMEALADGSCPDADEVETSRDHFESLSPIPLVYADDIQCIQAEIDSVECGPVEQSGECCYVLNILPTLADKFDTG